MGEATVEAITDLFGALDFHYSNEDDLQRGLAQALVHAGYDVAREVRLTRGDRIDLLVDRIGIEVKVAGQPDSVARQCRRYLNSGKIDELILVSTRPRHAKAVKHLPVTVIPVLRPW